MAKVECMRKKSQRLTPKNFISLNGAASEKKEGASEKSTSEQREEREEPIVQFMDVLSLSCLHRP